MRLTMATTSEGPVTLAGSDGRNSFLCKHVFLLRLRLHCQSPGTRGATGVDALVLPASLVSVLELPKAAAAPGRGSQPGQGGIRFARSHAESTSAFRGGLIVQAGRFCQRNAGSECLPAVTLALRAGAGPEMCLGPSHAASTRGGYDAERLRPAVQRGTPGRVGVPRYRGPSPCPPIRRAA